MAKRSLKKATGLLLCLSMIIGLFGTGIIVQAADSDPNVPPQGDGWRLANVIDFERPAYTADQELQSGSSAAYIRASADVPTGQYFSYEGTVGENGYYMNLGSLTADTVSLKFKLFMRSNFEYGSFFLEIDNGGIMMAPIQFMSSLNGYRMRYTVGDGQSGVRDFINVDEMKWNFGWNNVEVRFFKDGGNNYVRAEYYLNGKKGVTEGGTTRFTDQPSVNTIRVYVGNGDRSECPLIDEIHIYDKNAETLTKLAAPANVKVSKGGVVSFSDVANANAYAIRLYRDGVLASTVTTIPGVPGYTRADFSTAILSNVNADYTFSVQAKGNYTAFCSSDEIFVTDWEMPVEAPGKPGTPEWIDSTLLWDAADGASQYTVYLYKLPNVDYPVASVPNITADFCDLLKTIETNGNGKYKAAVRGINFAGEGPLSDLTADSYVYNFGSNQRLARVIDFEEPDFSVGELSGGTQANSTWIRTSDTVATGQYLSFEGNTGWSPRLIPLGDGLNSDVLSMKFKLYIRPNFNWGTFQMDITNGVTYLTSIAFYGAEQGQKMQYTRGDGSSALDDFVNEMKWKHGWNDIEIKFFKNGGSNYVSAEYYLNGKPGETSGGTLRFTDQPRLNNMQVYRWNNADEFGTGELFSIDEIQFFNLEEETLIQLANPMQVTANDTGVVTFSGVDNAKAYAVRMYRNGALAATKTVLPNSEKIADFSALVTGDAQYTYSVQAKGDYTEYRNSDEIYASVNRLIRVIDFEEPDFSVGELQGGTVATYIRTSASVPTGQYLSYEGSQEGGGYVLNLGSGLNSDILSVKFKLFMRNDFEYGSFSLNMRNGNNMIAPMIFNSNLAGKNMRYTVGDGGPGMTNFLNEMKWEYGWNDVEVKFYKDGGDNYIRAEYYLNGTKGETDGGTIRFNDQTQVDTIHVYTNSGAAYECMSIDEIQIYGISEENLTKLSNPENVKVSKGGVVTFNGVTGARAYSVRMYKNGKLAATKTTVPSEERIADFSDIVAENMTAGYTFSVQAKGDYVDFRNSNEVFAGIKYGPYMISTPIVSVSSTGAISVSALVTRIEEGAAAPYTLIASAYNNSKMIGTAICRLNPDSITKVGDCTALTGNVGTISEAEKTDLLINLLSWEDISILKPIDGIDVITLRANDIF